MYYSVANADTFYLPLLPRFRVEESITRCYNLTVPNAHYEAGLEAINWRKSIAFIGSMPVDAPSRAWKIYDDTGNLYDLGLD